MESPQPSEHRVRLVRPCGQQSDAMIIDNACVRTTLSATLTVGSVIDDQPVPGHVWVVAPPFEIVDIALKTQPYDRGEAGFVPDLLCLENAKRITAGPEDYCSGRVLRAA